MFASEVASQIMQTDNDPSIRSSKAHQLPKTETLTTQNGKFKVLVVKPIKLVRGPS